ncbi:MAG: hypothetical protein K9H62_24180 [Bacteroidales bacterium]|nr:hypothetical protein [Bacteroidales bacterium]
MNTRKISLVIALLLSVCFAYSQTDIIVDFTNITDDDYIIKIYFNQDDAYDYCLETVEFQLSGPTYQFDFLEYCFDEIDVNIERVECIPVPNFWYYPNYPYPSLDCNFYPVDIPVGGDGGNNNFHFQDYTNDEISPGYFVEVYVFLID